MLLPIPVRLPSQPLESAEPVQLRRDSPEQRQEFERAFGHARRAVVDGQAAVVHFGTRALGLARSQTLPGVAPEESEQGDPTGAEAALRPTDAEDAPSPEEQRESEQLRRRDREVRTHEQAHKAAGGPYTGSIRLSYQMGPDGKRYAVEGSVPIDVSPVAGDPAATLRKMEVVARAASAPASPSGADRAVAARAAQIAQRARAQLAAERYAQTRELVPGA